MSSPLPPPPHSKVIPPHLRRPARSNKGVVIGLLAFGLVAFSFPFYYVVTSNLDASKPLSTAAVRRGPYANTGSRDIGPVSVEEYVLDLIYCFVP